MTTNPPSRKFVDMVRARAVRDHEFRHAIRNEIDDAEKSGQQELVDRLRTVLTAPDQPRA